MQEKVFRDLVDFIYKQTGSYDVPITKETSLEDDLGITGDDGEDLIIAFGRRYNVNIVNFCFAKYFFPEPQMLSTPKEIKVLTVGHLLSAIATGRLDDEIINA